MGKRQKGARRERRRGARRERRREPGKRGEGGLGEGG